MSEIVEKEKEKQANKLAKKAATSAKHAQLYKAKKESKEKSQEIPSNQLNDEKDGPFEEDQSDSVNFGKTIIL